MAVARKLKRVLRSEFPAPDRVDLRDEDGIIGIVTSRSFAGMDTMQRQDRIHHILEQHLTPDEQRQVVMIVAVTPEEQLADTLDEKT